jgi:hypothetical protein
MREILTACRKASNKHHSQLAFTPPSVSRRLNPYSPPRPKFVKPEYNARELGWREVRGVEGEIGEQAQAAFDAQELGANFKGIDMEELQEMLRNKEDNQQDLAQGFAKDVWRQMGVRWKRTKVTLEQKERILRRYNPNHGVVGNLSLWLLVPFSQLKVRLKLIHNFEA